VINNLIHLVFANNVLVFFIVIRSFIVNFAL